MMKRRFFAILLAGVLALSLAACGGGGGSSDGGSGSSGTGGSGEANKLNWEDMTLVVGESWTAVPQRRRLHADLACERQRHRHRWRDGSATAVSKGMTTCTVSQGSQSRSCTVRVK